MAQSKRHLATLQRRLKHLEERVEGHPLDALSYDRTEINALRWALETLCRGGLLPLASSGIEDVAFVGLVNHKVGNSLGTSLTPDTTSRRTN